MIEAERVLATNRAGWNHVAPMFHGGTALPEYGPLAPTEDELRLLDDKPDLRALELGCGSGHSLRYLAERGARELWGIDLSPVQIAFAEETLRPFAPRVRLIESPMEVDPGVPSDHFDLVFSAPSSDTSSGQACRSRHWWRRPSMRPRSRNACRSGALLLCGSGGRDADDVHHQGTETVGRVMRLHERVQGVVDVYLEAVDHEAPGLIEGLYLTGSAALGEFRPFTSDVDFLAVTSTHPDAAALAALSRAHQRLRNRCSRPFFDGRYVTWDELTRNPQQAGPGPCSYEGRFRARAENDCDPVTWHTIAQHGIRCRGPAPSDLRIWTDPAALASWTLNNFDSYWQPLLRRARRFPDPWSITAFTSYGAVSVVLGVCRLHYTLATGRIGSKEEAGDYGLRTFPERWHLALRESLRIRRADRARPDVTSALFEMIDDLRIREAADGGSLYSTPVARRRDVLAFADMVIVDAKSLHSHV